ncbi:GxxExxY protein [Patescibacteria group bacterium]|nr:GxxExxY protein [Patescibacteria group bacterium]MBU1613292.1 GxxExxY protein [Patescibacteria group bacterium]
MYQIRRRDILFPELSFAITGALFDVYKQLGAGHLEKYYQKAVAISLRKREIKFVEQQCVPLQFDEINVGRYYVDFLIDDKIVLELKRGMFIPVNVLHQAKKYLIAMNLKLALIGVFTNRGVIVKRILNLY